MSSSSGSAGRAGGAGLFSAVFVFWSNLRKLPTTTPLTPVSRSSFVTDCAMNPSLTVDQDYVGVDAFLALKELRLVELGDVELCDDHFATTATTQSLSRSTLKSLARSRQGSI
jgi:hypothetical protein